MPQGAIPGGPSKKLKYALFKPDDEARGTPRRLFSSRVTR
ncbi:hypothetical protein Agau_L101727 [Agrobacterium tumefaciens F2]|nr:hypothetical protein Agau_L101727 [Agrobacterium tumefaciens F2]